MWTSFHAFGGSWGLSDGHRDNSRLHLTGQCNRTGRGGSCFTSCGDNGKDLHFLATSEEADGSGVILIVPTQSSQPEQSSRFDRY